MKMSKNRVLALLLVVLMAFTLTPFTVFAEDGEATDGIAQEEIAAEDETEDTGKIDEPDKTDTTDKEAATPGTLTPLGIQPRWSGLGTADNPILWDLASDGMLVINSTTSRGQNYYIVSGTWSSTINAYASAIEVNGVTANITLDNVNIDVSSTNHACAFKIVDGGDVTVTLEGDNTLRSGRDFSGLYAPKGNTLTIHAADADQSLTAKGGNYAAGIGGGWGDDGGTITINGGTVTATGGYEGAGIGGGSEGAGGDIAIGGTAVVTATGGEYSAGIGSGDCGAGGGTIAISGTAFVEATGGKEGAGIGGGGGDGYGDGGDIAISGTAVVAATGGEYGAGIGGGGYGGDGGDIAISGTAFVAATGGDYGAGIGGGWSGDGGNIAISGGTVMPTGGDYGAGIGGGYGGTGGTITIEGGIVEVEGGNGGAGIGGGLNGAGGSIKISGGVIAATGSSGGKDFGPGDSGTDGTITITGGSVCPTNGSVSPQPTNAITSVYLNTLTVGDPAVGALVPITAGSVDGIAMNNTPDPANGVYGIHDVVTAAGGVVYFWLTEDNSDSYVSVTADSVVYSNIYTRGTGASAVLYVPTITLSETTAYDFGSTAAGYTTAPAACTVTITNSGAGAANNLTVALGAGSTSSFTLDTASMLTLLSSGGTTTFTVQPKEGLAAGVYTETVTVSGYGVTPQSFTVSFTVTSSSSSGGSSSSSTTTYTVKFDANGGSAVSSQSVAKNNTVTKPTDPTYSGYTFTGWYTDAKLTEEYDFSAKVTGAFTLYAGWEKIAASEPGDAITHSAYLSGYPDGTFRPDNSLTRAEAAMLFNNLLGGNSGSGGVYPDVASGTWYCKAVTALSGVGVITGYPDGTFGPDNTITRAEFVAMAMRFAGVNRKTGSTGLSDVASAHWAAGYIAAAVDGGYLSGYPDGTFRPDGLVTRAEAVTILNNLRGCAGLDQGKTFSDVPETHWAYEAITAAATDHTHE